MGEVLESSKQLCWDCRKSYTKGCSWAAWFEPVPGWTAKEVQRREYMSWHVTACPEFERDSRGFGQFRLKGGREE